MNEANQTLKPTMGDRIRSVVARAKQRRSQRAGRVEQRLSLRLIVLATGLWAMATLGWVGSPAWIWLGGGLLQIIGHGYSWRFRGQQSIIRAVVIGGAIAASLPLVPDTVQAGATGDWLPAAHFVLLFQGIASFELRTRIGLYTSMTLSGVILFFATQRALDPVYGVFLTGFTVLVLSFLAVAFLIDHVRDSDIHWFRRRFAFAWFWIGVLIASFSLSMLAFLALPKSFMDPQNGLQGVILPFRSTGDFNGTQPSPLGAPIASALPVTASDIQARQPDSGTGATGLELPSSESERAGDPAGDGEETAFTDEGSFGGTQPSSSGLSQGADGTGSANGPAGGLESDEVEDLVMHVRSPVLTYWRGQVFGEFDGTTWRQTPSFISAQRLGDDRVMLRATGSSGRMGGPFYGQTYFIFRQPAPGMIFTGYAPVNAVLPADERGAPLLEDDSIYRVISAFPDFSPDALENARASSRLGQAYHYLPDSVASIEPLARELTEIAHTDLTRTRRIVGYLDTTFQFDEEAPDQLRLSMHPTEFLAEPGREGTAMDFATASVLLARAAGIPARLVTGYLPGILDPLSGAYVVRQSDAHAWAEVYFDGVGWVPFDSVPRPETAAFGSGGTRRSPLSNSLFGTSLSEEVFDAVKASPDSLNAALSRITNGPMGLMAGAGAIIAITLCVVGFMAWRGRRGMAVDSYTRLEGAYRSEVLKVQRRVDRMLARAGLGSRRTGQTIGDRWDSATWLDAAGLSDLWWLKRAAWAAAYDPAPYDVAQVFEAKDRAASIRRFLKSRQKPRIHADQPLT